jgi:hypothetical protein
MSDGVVYLMQINEIRKRKFLEKLKEAGDYGFFDHQLAEEFGWQLNSVKATAKMLSNENKVKIVSTIKGWYICGLD